MQSLVATGVSVATEVLQNGRADVPRYPPQYPYLLFHPKSVTFSPAEGVTTQGLLARELPVLWLSASGKLSSSAKSS